MQNEVAFSFCLDEVHRHLFYKAAIYVQHRLDYPHPDVKYVQRDLAKPAVLDQQIVWVDEVRVALTVLVFVRVPYLQLVSEYVRPQLSRDEVQALVERRGVDERLVQHLGVDDEIPLAYGAPDNSEFVRYVVFAILQVVAGQQVLE